MRYLLLVILIGLQGCSSGLLQSGAVKRAFPIVTPAMTLDYNPPKQIGTYLQEVYWQHLYIPAAAVMMSDNPQDIMMQVCHLFPEFNSKKQMQVFTGISRREDIPAFSNDWMLKTTTEIEQPDVKQKDDGLFAGNSLNVQAASSRQSHAARWFVYVPPNRIYMNPSPHNLSWQFDNPIYLKNKPCKQVD